MTTSTASATRLPGKLSLRQRYKELEKFCNALKVNSENATFVANAMFWKHGYKNRAEIKAVVDEYMAHMQGEVQKAKDEGKVKVIENFIDPAILAKAQEFDDSDCTDSDFTDSDDTVYFD